MTARHLSRRFVERSDIEDLNNAITCQREALSICFPGQNDTSEGDDEAIHTLAVDLNISEETSEKSRFQALAKLGGLDEESESYADWTSHRRRYSDLLEDLAAFLVLRFEDTTQIQDIDEAIDLRRQLLQLPSTMRNGGNIASLLNRLGDALVLRFKEQGRLEDLDEAVDCQTKVLSICADDDSRRPEFLESITDALILRFAKQGRTVTEDIDAAIDCQRELVALQLRSVDSVFAFRGFSVCDPLLQIVRLRLL